MELLYDQHLIIIIMLQNVQNYEAALDLQHYKDQFELNN